MRFFVTGVNGQLGHDVMNELHKRDHDGVGSDIATAYAGFEDESAVTTMPYVSLDITDKEAVWKAVTVLDRMLLFTVQHGQLWIWPKMMIRWRRSVPLTQEGHRISQTFARPLIVKCFTYLLIMYSMAREGPWKPDCKNYNPLNI